MWDQALVLFLKKSELCKVEVYDTGYFQKTFSKACNFFSILNLLSPNHPPHTRKEREGEERGRKGERENIG